MYAQKNAVASKAIRVDKRTRDAQARLADKSFPTFMREHNRAHKPFEPNPRGL